MGERQTFQPLTREDKITVVLYRAGIALSTIIIACLTSLLAAVSDPSASRIGRSADVLIVGLYMSVGLSVFFIHLYVRKFKRILIYLFLISLGCLAALLSIGRGSLTGALRAVPYGPLLLMPLACCLAFVAAKEAFCFRLLEGYLLALIMPVFLLLAAGGMLSGGGALSGMVLTAALLVIFTARKVFQPLAFDIGDKTAYR